MHNGFANLQIPLLSKKYPDEQVTQVLLTKVLQWESLVVSLDGTHKKPERAYPVKQLRQFPFI